MAMNKKEQQEYDYARSFRSLRFSDYPDKPDIPVGTGLSVGFDINVSRVLNSGSLSSGLSGVYTAWSKGTVHGTGDGSEQSQRHSSRGGIPLYSSRLRALGALRRKLEDQYARVLMEIDDAIAKEACKEAESDE